MLHAILFTALLGCTQEPAPAGSSQTPIRIGWQTTWATQGQLAVILKKTEILEQNGFDAEFVGFSYGGPLNEGALAGEVDVIFTADQPAISLASRAPSWGVIGRLMYNRVGTFVPPDSPVHNPSGLRGRRVAIPFGAAAHRETLRDIKDAGLDPGSDVDIVNLGVQEIVALIGAGATDGRWGTIDAGSAWDPAFAQLEHVGAVRTIGSGQVTSVVVMDDGFVQAHPGADARFMSAMHGAWEVYRQDPSRADQWFSDEAKLSFKTEVLQRAASVEPNLGEQGIRLALTDSDLAAIQDAADFMLGEDLLKAPYATTDMIRETARREPTTEAAPAGP